MHDIFYFTDLHGQLDLFYAMRDWCLRKDPECTIIFGGDACDRGAYGLEIIRELLLDTHMIYLKGNHEQMFATSIQELLRLHPEIKNQKLEEAEAKKILEDAIMNSHSIYMHLRNGGLPTLLAWMKEGCDATLADDLNNLYLTFSLNGGIDFCHSGQTPKAFERVFNAEYEKKHIDPFDAEDLLWDRSYLARGWLYDRIMIHGHTPTCLLPESIACSEKFAVPIAWHGWINFNQFPGWRIDMDTGATWTGRAYVLNCLTFECVGFHDPNINQKDLKKPHPIVPAFETFKII